jgi:hypothetical protein
VLYGIAAAVPCAVWDHCRPSKICVEKKHVSSLQHMQNLEDTVLQSHVAAALLVPSCLFVLLG